MITMKQLTESPLEPYERSVLSRTKVIAKMQSDFNKISSLASVVDAKILDGVFKTRVRIPSEPFLGKLFYDVAINFSMEETGGKITKGTPIRVYSNMPSFMFTYAYVFNKNDALIEEFKKLIGRRPITEAPSVNNPKQLIGFDKSLFYALLQLRNVNAISDPVGFLDGFRPAPRFKNKKMDSTQSKLNEYNQVKKENSSEYNDYKKRGKIGFF